VGSTSVTIKLQVSSACEAVEIDGVKSNIEAEVNDILGCWVTGSGGTVSFTHSCSNSKKRQATSSQITTEVQLTGPYVTGQSNLIADNFPSNATVDGVSSTLLSATAADSGGGGGGGLSGGAIAGIVIGSIVAFILVLAAVFLFITKTQHVESV